MPRLRAYAKALKTELYALYLAIRHPRTPWQAKALAFLTLAYALSPVDLIPDFIPVIGYLDDLLIVPLGIRLSLRAIPPDVMEECRHKARALDGDQQRNALRSKSIKWIGLFVVLLLWGSVILLGTHFL